MLSWRLEAAQRTGDRVMLGGGLEDLVLTALCYSENLAPKLAERLRWQDFSTNAYRRAAEEALGYISKFNRPPRIHLADLLEEDIKRGRDSRFTQEVVDEVARYALDLDEEYVWDRLAEFLEIQRLNNIVNTASDHLRDGRLGDAKLLLNAVVELPAPPVEPAYPELDNAALHGLAGEVVNMIAPHTEAHPAALLFQFLAAVGNMIGRKPYFRVEADDHHANLFTVVVGRSSKDRKGTSWGHIRALGECDPEWSVNCLFTGALGSGEGIIHRVRDGQEEKRLCVVTTEFGNQLRVMQRKGSTVSGIMRDAWDSLKRIHAPLVKHDSECTTDAHISVIAHITQEELQRDLEDVDIANGFGNRFLFVCGQRARVLPLGGQLEDAERAGLSRKVFHVARWASAVGEVKFDAEAAGVWCDIYPGLSKAQEGLFGAVIARAEAQVRRLALIYSLLDRSPVTRFAHLEAAVAAWGYAEASASYLFGDKMGNKITDTILRNLRQAGAGGLSRTDINHLFQGNEKASTITKALERLEQQGYIGQVATAAGGGPGRPITQWRALK